MLAGGARRSSLSSSSIARVRTVIVGGPRRGLGVRGSFFGVQERGGGLRVRVWFQGWDPRSWRGEGRRSSSSSSRVRVNPGGFELFDTSLNWHRTSASEGMGGGEVRVRVRVRGFELSSFEGMGGGEVEFEFEFEGSNWHRTSALEGMGGGSSSWSSRVRTGIVRGPRKGGGGEF